MNPDCQWGFTYTQILSQVFLYTSPHALIVVVQLDNVSDVQFDATAYVGVGKREGIGGLLEGHQTELDALSQTSDPVEFILVDHEISP